MGRVVPTLDGLGRCQPAFAFDGTVTAIADGSGGGEFGELGYVDVTFSVREWFHGGGADRVTVQMWAPPPTAGQAGDYGAGYYGVGTRLLVTGEPRWGGEPLNEAVAWFCGFTRTYDDSTATAWRETFRELL